MALQAVTEALKALSNDSSREDGNLLDSDEPEDQTYFCVEDTFLSKDINVTVEGVGDLSFPISEETVDSLIRMSSKAKFGKGEDTVLDTSVRDTQMIPASKLKVKVNEDSLKNTLERVAEGLKIHESCTLVPNLFNMLIYGPGQFFNLHRDSEKEKNMVATLVIVLPCYHKGGDLIVKHQDKQHVFFGSRNPDFIKCVMFYSDCHHEIKKVTEGFRIALTYNVVLKSPEIISTANVNVELHEAVCSYFNCPMTKPKRLIYYLNHSYSEHSLKWHLLKGTDRNEAFSLFSVAKHEGYIPCLALLKYTETYDVEDDSSVLDCQTNLVYWVDEQSVKFQEHGSSNYVSENEVCYTIKTTDLLKPYQTEESGPTGNEGETIDYWYRRACVVLWSKQHYFFHGYKSLLYDLHKFTAQPGNEAVLRNEVNKVGPEFFQEGFFGGEFLKKLLDIAIYINDKAVGVSLVCKNLRFIVSNNTDVLVQIENQYDDETWTKIFDLWKKNYDWYETLKSSFNNIIKYCKVSSNRFVANTLIKEIVDNVIMTITLSDVQYKYGTVNNYQTERFFDVFQICFDFERLDLVDKLVHFTLDSSNDHRTNLICLASVLCKLNVSLTPSQFLYCRTFRDSVLTAIEKEIAEVTFKVDDWQLPIKMSCTCIYCSKVQTFFNSKSVKRLVLPAAKHNRRHVYSYLNPFAGRSITFSTERTGSPYKIIIEKDPKLLTDRERFLTGLKLSQESLVNLEFLKPFSPSSDKNNTDVREGLSPNTLPLMQLSEENAPIESTSECAELPIKRLKQN